MERVHTLLEKLKLQSDEHAPAAAMLHTVEMLHAEIIRQMGYIPTVTQQRVSVIVPGIIPFRHDAYFQSENTDNPEEKIIKVLQVDEREIEKELAQIKQHAEEVNAMSSHAKPKPTIYEDPMLDIPTLSHQDPPRHPEERMPRGNQSLPDTPAYPESLNDRLKETKTELSESLNASPIKDLRKAIPVNDRFIFINGLFRGDEAMYERSIKTIQGYGNVAEAEFWIRRELKVKIGWLDNDPLVKQFDELVKRRFS